MENNQLRTEFPAITLLFCNKDTMLKLIHIHAMICVQLYHLSSLKTESMAIYTHS